MAAVSLDYVYRLVNSAWDKINDYQSDLKDALKKYDNYIADLTGDIKSLKGQLANIPDLVADYVEDFLGGITPDSIDNAFEHVYNYIFDKVADIKADLKDTEFTIRSELVDIKKSIPDITELDDLIDERLKGIEEKAYNLVSNRLIELVDKLLDQEVK